MSTASPGPPIMPAVKPARRRWPYLLAGVVLLLATPFAYYALLQFRTQNDWRAAEAETDALDPRWRMEQILADLAPIPDDENIALATIRILAPGRTNISIPPKRYEVLFPDDYPVNAEMNPEQIKFLRESFKRIGNRLDDARELRKYTRGRFKLAISEDFFSTQIPDHQEVRILAEWLIHDARLVAQDDEMDKALQSCESCLALGCAFCDDPYVMAFLIQCAMHSDAVTAFERVLAQGEAADAVLLRVQKRVLTEYRTTSWLAAMRGDRAGHHLFFEGVRAGRQKLGGWIFFRINNENLLVDIKQWGADTFPAVYLRQYPDHLRYNTALVEITKLPYHERKGKLAAHQDSLYASTNAVMRTFAIAGAIVHAAEGRTRGLLLSAAVAIACERYRLQHPQRTWPSTLEEVVKKGLLDEVPRDPIDNQPLRFRTTKEGIVVYSIGPDGNDDGGKIERNNTNRPGVDVGFRLWNVNLRRQRALPAPAELEVPN
ncbi:MAG: hypothetical protein EXS16_16700 [Gemmataceae bacterium]|nr:hypothetical protein [Gemmataceae bacterium]